MPTSLAPPQPFPIPQAAADRLFASLAELCASARQHVQSESTPATQRPAWKYVADLLGTRQSLLQAAEPQLRAGDQAPLAEAASLLRFLARDLDGYPITPEMEQTRLTLVQTAWQIHAAASGHPASGL